MTGRPCSFSPEVAAAIIEALQDGAPCRVAAERAGISESTLRRWLAQGRKEKEGKFCPFWQAVKKARAEAIHRNVLLIQAAAIKSWQAAAWWLERMYPELFASDRELLEEIKREFKKRKRAAAAEQPDE